MSPRAIDKRARPGNEAHRTADPPRDLVEAEEDPAPEPEVQLESAESASQG